MLLLSMKIDEEKARKCVVVVLKVKFAFNLRTVQIDDRSAEVNKFFI